MRQQIGLGFAAGVMISVMCWRGNQTPQVVSTFPDGVTFLMLVILLGAAVWLDQRWRGRAASLRSGLTIAAAAGLIFGSTVALLGALLFTRPAFELLAFGFLSALGSSIIVGGGAALALSRWRPTRPA